MRPPARLLRLGDPPDRWAALGFAVEDGALALGGVRVELTGAGGGIESLGIEGLAGEAPDALAIEPAAAASVPAGSHPNGAIAIDHVVAFTDDLARTVAALEDAGLELRRRRDPPEAAMPQAFFNLDTLVLEVGETDRVQGAGFWGLVVVMEDLDAAVERLGDLVGTPRAAVQAGRRIATVRREAGLGVSLALMTPRVRTR